MIRQNLILNGMLLFLSLAGTGQVWAMEGASSGTATLSELTGEVRYKNPGDADWRSAQNGTLLLEGAHVFVGEESECQLILEGDSKSVTRLKQDTRAILKSLGTAVQIEVTSGELFSLFKRMDQKSSFQVLSPTAVASARGTAFSFAADGIGREVSNTVEVYSHAVGLSPLDAPDKEIVVGEGQGVVMGAGGNLEKQFEVPAEDMRTAREFAQQAETFFSERPDQKIDAPPADTKGDDTTSRVDSAMDGVVMGMARDSELAQSETFDGETLSHDVSKLSELSFGSAPVDGSALPGGSIAQDATPSIIFDTVRSAVMQSDHFLSQSPETQNQMLAEMDRNFERYASEFRDGSPDGVHSMSGDGFRSGTGGDSSERPFGDSDGFHLTEHGTVNGLVSPGDLASVINEQKFKPEELRSIINFMAKIQQDFQTNGASPAYFNNPRIVPNFEFVKDNVTYVGSIIYTPTALHSHTGTSFLHLENVVVKDDPTGSGGNVIVSPTDGAPGGVIEVPSA